MEKIKFVGIEVHTAVSVKSTMFSPVIPCSLVKDELLPDCTSHGQVK
jgi:hypothetical protein